VSGRHRQTDQSAGAFAGGRTAHHQKSAVSKKAKGRSPSLFSNLVVVILLLVLVAVVLLILAVVAGAVVILLLSAILIALVVLAVAAVLAVLIFVVVLHDSHLTAVSMPNQEKFLSGLHKKF
jgi:glucan phosphoethanolaminetransferase (alkaline phosphatase superfamily)